MSLALMDIKEGRKISADFHVDLNHEAVRQMVGACCNSSNGQAVGLGGQENGHSSPAEKKSGDCCLGLDLEHWLCFPEKVQDKEHFTHISVLLTDCLMFCLQAIFSVTNPHTDIVMVARVEKVLMGNIACGTEPYIKNTDSSKVRQSVLVYKHIA